MSATTLSAPHPDHYNRHSIASEGNPSLARDSMAEHDFPPDDHLAIRSEARADSRSPSVYSSTSDASSYSVHELAPVQVISRTPARRMSTKASFTRYDATAAYRLSDGSESIGSPGLKHKTSWSNSILSDDSVEASQDEEEDSNGAQVVASAKRVTLPERGTTMSRRISLLPGLGAIAASADSPVLSNDSRDSPKAARVVPTINEPFSPPLSDASFSFDAYDHADESTLSQSDRDAFSFSDMPTQQLLPSLPIDTRPKAVPQPEEDEDSLSELAGSKKTKATKNAWRRSGAVFNTDDAQLKQLSDIPSRTFIRTHSRSGSAASSKSSVKDSSSPSASPLAAAVGQFNKITAPLRIKSRDTSSHSLSSLPRSGSSSSLLSNKFDLLDKKKVRTASPGKIALLGSDSDTQPEPDRSSTLDVRPPTLSLDFEGSSPLFDLDFSKNFLIDAPSEPTASPTELAREVDPVTTAASVAPTVQPETTRARRSSSLAPSITSSQLPLQRSSSFASIRKPVTIIPVAEKTPEEDEADDALHIAFPMSNEIKSSPLPPLPNETYLNRATDNMQDKLRATPSCVNGRDAIAAPPVVLPLGTSLRSTLQPVPLGKQSRRRSLLQLGRKLTSEKKPAPVDPPPAPPVASLRKRRGSLDMLRSAIGLSEAAEARNADTSSRPPSRAATINTDTLDARQASPDSEHSPVDDSLIKPAAHRKSSLPGRVGMNKGTNYAFPEHRRTPSSVTSHESASSSATSRAGTLPRRDQSTPSPTARKRGPDSGFGSDSSLSAAWIALEDSLSTFVNGLRTNKADRSEAIIRGLLPFLAAHESDNTTSDVLNASLARRQRDILHAWVLHMLQDLRIGPANRGACLEGIAKVMESPFFSYFALLDDLAGQRRYASVLVSLLDFAVEKLNEKAVYANTLAFAGRLLAVAYFRLEDVGLKLMRLLPPLKPKHYDRIVAECLVSPVHGEKASIIYPPHLDALIYKDARSTAAIITPMRAVEEDEDCLAQNVSCKVEMTGNWLIRWTASDSDLPFAFYRAYYRQLASYIAASPASSSHVSLRDLLRAPGFVSVTASVLEKLDALVHRNMRSVTTLSPSGTDFSMSDHAQLAMGAKPKVLDMAHRRIATSLLEIVSQILPTDDIEQEPRYPFADLLSVWMRALTKRTSLYDVRGGFLLLDLVETLLHAICTPTSQQGGLEDQVSVRQQRQAGLRSFDTTFVLSFVRTILLKADNTVCLMRTIAFLYSSFDILTTRPQDRDMLCETVLLDEDIFERLFLHWNMSVRGYFMRLLVWRLSGIGTSVQDNPDSASSERTLALLRVFSLRLESIRRRHDEIDPLDKYDDDDYFRPKRSTICSTQGVSEQPWTVDEIAGDADMELTYRSDDASDGDSFRARGASRELKDVPGVSRVVGWLKGNLRKRSTSRTRPGTPVGSLEPFNLHIIESSPTSSYDIIEPQRDFAQSEDGTASVDQYPSEADVSAFDDAMTSQTSVSASGSPPVTPKPRREALRRSGSGNFFRFEFENETPVSDAFDAGKLSPAAKGVAIAPRQSSIGLPTTPSPKDRRLSRVVVSHRASRRFSKRASILPSPAVAIFTKHGSLVPTIPDDYTGGYDKRLHQYAIRALRDYEDALIENETWQIRPEEEDMMEDTTPRLGVAWPQIFTD
ncbi:uncharacterized protein L969DRAFT_87615 [Mixia osmundae IAM 14324]|uniref:Uncharacterized protein n=1 Tax=Mixia osmundae (strain CBS 9802 / IAM 14324 / JCM 22182 / KY 12970) TaxID=764103 RepID=G7DVR5_MIXOS|nr:uncharacterized protein L969DRAFT_87615 [Mixia osmundae IAM 14324]KEI39644.1 hypothetical protein L969DRAFT_87615 [Mixia osmundae IAM 14324]GAA94675.1 hypothetical protein E5Q_01328 [Mixia osmundae IAM 14324]